MNTTTLPTCNTIRHIAIGGRDVSVLIASRNGQELAHYPATLTHHRLPTLQDTRRDAQWNEPAPIVAELKAWAEANYNRGADTFVECYDRTDWQRLLAEHHYSKADTLRTLRSCASVYRERYADTRNSAF